MPLDMGLPVALAGRVLAYECQDKPEDPELVQLTSTHKGLAGILDGNVYCVILQQFENIKPPDGASPAP